MKNVQQRKRIRRCSSQGQKSLSPFGESTQSSLQYLNSEDKDFLLHTLFQVMEESSEVLHKMYNHLNNQDYEALASVSEEYQDTIRILDDPKFQRLLQQIDNERFTCQETNHLLPLIKELETICACMKSELDEGLHMLSTNG